MMSPSIFWAFFGVAYPGLSPDELKSVRAGADADVPGMPSTQAAIRAGLQICIDVDGGIVLVGRQLANATTRERAFTSIALPELSALVGATLLKLGPAGHTAPPCLHLICVTGR
jgi:hypothetical protein